MLETMQNFLIMILFLFFQIIFENDGQNVSISKHAYSTGFLFEECVPDPDNEIYFPCFCFNLGGPVISCDNVFGFPDLDMYEAKITVAVLLNNLRWLDEMLPIFYEEKWQSLILLNISNLPFLTCDYLDKVTYNNENVTIISDINCDFMSTSTILDATTDPNESLLTSSLGATALDYDSSTLSNYVSTVISTDDYGSSTKTNFVDVSTVITEVNYDSSSQTNHGAAVTTDDFDVTSKIGFITDFSTTVIDSTIHVSTGQVNLTTEYDDLTIINDDSDFLFALYISLPLITIFMFLIVIIVIWRRKLRKDKLGKAINATTVYLNPIYNPNPLVYEFDDNDECCV